MQKGFLVAAAGHHALALGLLAGKLASATNALGLFAHTLLRRLLIEATLFHFTEYAFTLQLLLERAEGLIDIVVSDDDLQGRFRQSTGF